MPDLILNLQEAFLIMNKERGLLVPGTPKPEESEHPHYKKIMRKVLKKEIQDA